MSEQWRDIRATQARRVKRGKRAVRGNNANVTGPKPQKNPPQPPPPKFVPALAGVRISCCICLNQGQRTDAATIVNGYAVCERHLDLASKPDFDIFLMRGDVRRPV